MPVVFQHAAEIIVLLSPDLELTVGARSDTGPLLAIVVPVVGLEYDVLPFREPIVDAGEYGVVLRTYAIEFVVVRFVRRIEGLIVIQSVVLAEVLRLRIGERLVGIALELAVDRVDVDLEIFGDSLAQSDGEVIARFIARSRPFVCAGG